MKRYMGFLKETWWVWALFILISSVVGIFMPITFIAIPISIVSFVYFGLMRYDIDGNPKTGD